MIADSPMLQSTVKEPEIFAEPPPELNVPGDTGVAVDWDLDCNEKNNTPIRQAFFIFRHWILGLHCPGSL
jgi:hypothetical protein